MPYTQLNKQFIEGNFWRAHYFALWLCEITFYAVKPDPINALEDNMRRVCADIRQQLLQKIVENWAFRLEFIRTRRDSHLPKIIF